MATIEPRLIHLLNDDPQTPNLRPLNRVRFDVPSAVSLPPIEPDPSYRSDHPTTITHRPPLHGVGDDPLAKQGTRSAENVPISEPTGRVVKSAPSLQQLLGDTEPSHSSSSLPLRMLVDDPVDSLDDPSTKKRHRGVSQKDDFMQLPQPLKKQKSTKRVVPPIIAGLHEPPPNPGVFPPIHSEPDELGLFDGDFPNVDEDRSSMALGANASDSGEKSNSGDKITETAKGKRRVAKPRRKWSDEETNNLLLGVSRYGVGKWTSILEDKDFKFNDRTAGDLKDRFRTCCPDEFLGLVLSAAKARRSGKNGSNGRVASDCVPANHLNKFYHSSGLPKATKTKSVPNDRLVEPESAATSAPATPALAPGIPATAAAEHVTDQQPRQRTERELLHPSSVDSDSAPGSLGRQRKSRAHRKKLEDLAELGIHAPFKRSHRRERRPFTEQDDKEILEGLDYYGPAWTKIQRDKRFHLMSRQPTDLRDRVRNKYPDIYSKIEKGSFHAKNKRRGGRKGGETGDDGEGEGEGSQSGQHRDEENNGGNQASPSGVGDKVHGEADGSIDAGLPLRSSGRLQVRGEVASGQLLEPAVNTTIEKAFQQHGPGQEQMAVPGVKVQKLMPLAPYPAPESRLTTDTPDTPAGRWKGKVPVGLGIAGANGTTSTENAFLSPSEMDISRLLLDDVSGSGVKRSGNMAGEHYYSPSHLQDRQQHASQRHVPPHPPQPQSHHVRYGEGPSPALGHGYDYGTGRRA